MFSQCGVAKFIFYISEWVLCYTLRCVVAPNTDHLVTIIPMAHQQIIVITVIETIHKITGKFT